MENYSNDSAKPTSNSNINQSTNQPKQPVTVMILTQKTNSDQKTKIQLSKA